MQLPLILACIAVLLAAGVAGAALARAARASDIVYGLALGASAVILVAAFARLLIGGAPTRVLPLGLPWLGMHLRLDGLSSFFLVVVNLGGAAASLTGLGHGRHEAAPARVLPFFPAFLAGMNLVVLADDAFTFLLAWEFMSLVSWALVMAHHREPGSARAGFVYLVMASFGTLMLLLAFGLLAGSQGGYRFDAIRAGTLPPDTAALVLALALLGAGSKAGLVPLHVWLPLAHPAAPSHVSALMSGVMTKVAVYALVRLLFDLLGEPVWWWSIVLLVLGGVTAVLGILSALMQRDLKRLLAYSTVENIGVVTIGLGLALAFQANGMAGPAALALTASLFHVVNHALFKSLLFLGAGAVLAATGTRDMDRLGGLIHRMPVTAFTFLVGAAAISALPPLNGFVSEWLTFQTVLLSLDLPQWGLKLLVPAVAAALALAAALAAACFVKAFGITFLGRPRSAAAATAGEIDRFALAALAALALLSALAGVLPGLVVDALAPVVGLLNGGVRLPAQAAMPWLTLVPIAAGRSSYNGILVLLFVAASATLAAWAIHRWGSHALRRSAPWDCGHPDPDPALQYTAGSFAQPLRRVFGPTAFAARERVMMPPPGDLRPARYEVVLHDLVWDRLYVPVAGAVGLAADRLNGLQFLTVRRYLSLVFGALVGLLLVLALWS